MTLKPIHWTVIQQIGGQVSKYVVFLVLAFLLPPRDFGVIGLTLTWIAFILVFAEIGFSAALIQRPTLEAGHLSATFYLNIGLGIILTLLSIASAKPVALFYRLPEIQDIIIVLSFNFIINALSLTQLALAQREFRFKDLAIRDIAASLFGGLARHCLCLSRLGRLESYCPTISQ